MLHDENSSHSLNEHHNTSVLQQLNATSSNTTNNNNNNNNNNNIPNGTKNGVNKKGKSQFYLPDNAESTNEFANTHHSYTQHSSISDLFHGLTMLPKNVFKEKPIAGLHNVTCVYSSDYFNVNTLRADCVNVTGRLLLTNFKLAFLPYPVKYDANKLFNVDHRLELFRNTHSPLDFVIPLSYIYDIKGCKFFKMIFSIKKYFS